MKQMLTAHKNGSAWALAAAALLLGVLFLWGARPCAAQYAPLNQAAVGNYVKFGTYPQGDNGEKEPIVWRVLQKNPDSLLLISQHGLDVVPYDPANKPITWKDCGLRAWLNRDFADTAFTAAERERLVYVRNANPANPQFKTPGDVDTVERIWLLSIDEAKRYFKDDLDRMCYPTPYARSKGAYTVPDDGMCWTWLRSPGKDPVHAACVYTFGNVEPEGCGVYYTIGCVRPVIKVKL